MKVVINPTFRFTIRDLLWLTLVIGVSTLFGLERHKRVMLVDERNNLAERVFSLERENDSMEQYATGLTRSHEQISHDLKRKTEQLDLWEFNERKGLPPPIREEAARAKNEAATLHRP